MTLVIALSVWLVNANGLLQRSDECLGDLLGVFSTRSHARSDLLLVYASQNLLDSDDGELVNLVRAINEFEPAQIGIVHPLSKRQIIRLDSESTSTPLVLGYKRGELPDPGGTREAVSDSLQRGFIDLHLDQQGVYRQHIFRETVDGVEALSLQAQMMDPALLDQVPNGPAYVRFFGGVDETPNVNATDFDSGRVIKELVQDRIVLIGSAGTVEHGVVTPTTSGRQRMSVLELHGNILKTALNASFATPTSGIASLAIICGFVALLVQVLRNVAILWIARAWSLACVAVVIGGWICADTWMLHLPTTALLIAATMVLVGVFHARFRALGELVESWRILRQANDGVRPSEGEIDGWAAIAQSASQVFQPERMVLMELAPGKAHLNVRHLYQCENSDIGEKRRDINRVPYRPAIDENYPTSPGERSFFRVQGDAENANAERWEFIVPLIVVSEVVGVMVLEMDAANIKQWNGFEQSLSQYAGEMAVYLIASRVARNERARANSVIKSARWLPEQAMIGDVEKDEQRQQDYEALLRGTFESSESAIAVFDAFGRLVRSNSKMLDRLQQDDITIEGVNCVEVISSLTSRDLASCRNSFRRCIVESSSEKIVIANDCDGSSVMFLKPLKQLASGEANSTHSRFVSVEIISGELFDSLDRWQRGFAESQRSVGSFDPQPAICDSEENGPVGNSVMVARDLLEDVLECQATLGATLTDSPVDAFPLDSALVFDLALKSQGSVMSRVGMGVCNRLSNDIGKTIANPFLLEQAFATAIECLAEDADAETELLVSSSPADATLRYQLTTRLASDNSDLIPELLNTSSEAKQDHLMPLDAIISRQHLDRLCDINRWMEPWGGTLTVDTDSRYRLVISITLRTVDTLAPSSRKADSDD